MSYELSMNTRRGFQLAAGLGGADERLHARKGLLPISERGFTHGQMVQRAQALLSLTQDGDEANTWALLAFYAASFSGALQAADELRIDSGDESEMAA